MIRQLARGAEPGPTLVLVAGLHGNEPAGVEACRRMMARLERHPPARGEVVSLVGNEAALAAGRRYLVRDLNRQWTDEGLAAARASASRDAETAALARLADAIDAAAAHARGPFLVLDLHTSSSPGIPFAIVADGAEDRAVAARLVVPAILGLIHQTSGTLTGWLARRGVVAIAVEGGQHDEAETVANLEAVVTLALEACGLEESGLPHADARVHLERARGALPPLIEAVSRHALLPGSDFRMERGFANIHPVVEGMLIAREHGADVLAPSDGYVLLPLYQAQGDDGFFFGRDVAGPEETLLAGTA